MHGKTVKFRHCPATVSGSNDLHLSLHRKQPVWEGKCEASGCAASQETGSANCWELFSEGERIMAVLTFLFFLFVSPSEILKGVILDPAGAVVAGAKVEISGPGVSRSVSTSDSGVFSIEDVPAGAYSLRVTANGFAAYTRSVDIPSDSLKLVLRVAPHSEDVIVTTTQVETPLSMLGVSATVL